MSMYMSHAYYESRYGTEPCGVAPPMKKITSPAFTSGLTVHTVAVRQREREGETDRQTDRQTDRDTERQRDRETENTPDDSVNSFRVVVVTNLVRVPPTLFPSLLHYRFRVVVRWQRERGLVPAWHIHEPAVRLVDVHQLPSDVDASGARVVAVELVVVVLRSRARASDVLANWAFSCISLLTTATITNTKIKSSQRRLYFSIALRLGMLLTPWTPCPPCPRSQQKRLRELLYDPGPCIHASRASTAGCVIIPRNGWACPFSQAMTSPPSPVSPDGSYTAAVRERGGGRGRGRLKGGSPR